MPARAAGHEGENAGPCQQSRLAWAGIGLPILMCRTGVACHAYRTQSTCRSMALQGKYRIVTMNESRGQEYHFICFLAACGMDRLLITAEMLCITAYVSQHSLRAAHTYIYCMADAAVYASLPLHARGSVHPLHPLHPP